MENKDLAYWKRQYELNQMLYAESQADLTNYRDLVVKLRAEIMYLKEQNQSYKNILRTIEKDSENTILNNLQYGYSDTYLN